MFEQFFWTNRVVSYLSLTVAFGLFYALNQILTSPLLLVPGAHLIHPPSGIKFLMVLIFGWTGALSIFTVSLVAGLIVNFPGQWLVCLMLASSCTLAPLLGNKLGFHCLNIDHQLNHLNLKNLLIMGLVFSFLNSAFNQLTLYWNDVVHNFMDGLLVMFTGDITGVMLCVGSLKLLLRLFKFQIPDCENNRLSH